MPMRLNRSTRARAEGKARVHKDWKQQESERELKTNSERAREQAAREKVETNRGTWLNVIFRERVTLENTATSSRPEIKGTGETWAEARAKCTPAKWSVRQGQLTGPRG